jgi:uncharacterized protein YjiK
MMMRVHSWFTGLLLSSPALGGVTSVDLSDYQLSATHSLPAMAASEASAVTYNPDTGTLFVLGDEGDALVEVTTTGQLIGQMTLTGFDDTEGLTYIGNGQFVIVEERIQDVFLLTYSAGGSVDRTMLPGVSLGPDVGNIGLEGLSFDPLAGTYILVKEKTPQAVLEATIDWDGPSGSAVDLFVPNLGVLDLSDVQVLTTVPSLIGTADHDNLLIYSQESRRLMEVTRSGVLLSSFDFTAIAADAEGVTIGPDGTIYVVGETPALYVLTPIPACPADVTPPGGDRVVNIDDLLAVINTWGACANPRDCPADVAPVGGNDVVDIDDLLTIINSWGACP